MSAAAWDRRRAGKRFEIAMRQGRRTGVIPLTVPLGRTRLFDLQRAARRRGYGILVDIRKRKEVDQ